LRDEVHIVGTGASISTYGWPDDVDRWSVGSAASGILEAEKRVDLFFNMHDFQEPIPDHDNIGLGDYPLADVIRFFNSRYFTSSIAYMLALAIYRGYKKIVLIGIDMEVQSEYEFERPCVAYWIGQADARGITVMTTSGFCDPVFLYGYNEKEKARFQASITPRIIYEMRAAKGAKDKKNEVEAIGHYGKARAYEILLHEILGE
jgi:hypothetical protein